MEAVLERLPQVGQLTIQVSAPINYSARVAQRQVGHFVANEISYLLRADEPVLVVSDHLVWRVPVILALPTTGPLGQVGTIDVNVETGQLSITPEQIASMTRRAEELAQRAV